MADNKEPSKIRLGQRIPSGPRPVVTRRSTDQLKIASILDSYTAGANSAGSHQDVQYQITASPEQSPPSSLASPLSSPPITTAASDSKLGLAGFAEPNVKAETTTQAESGPSRPSTPVQNPKGKPKALRLNTANLLSPSKSSQKVISPTVKHWQQVRGHVLATPVDERPGKPTKGLVKKAAAKFGFRHAAEAVMGYDDRRRSMAVVIGNMAELSLEEREEIARERRKFARDVKTCLDACAAEESRRRLMRAAARRRNSRDGKAMPPTDFGNSSRQSTFNFNPDFSAYAPLLTELHKYLPAARARKVWSRTCPHHGAILAELGTAFIPGSQTSDGERQQALEVFGVIVRSWAADNADEELSRWVWLCKALMVGDRQLRNRGLPLLSGFLHSDPNLPGTLERPHSALAFQTLAMSIIQLVFAMQKADYTAGDHLSQVTSLLQDLAEGGVIDVNEKSLVSVIGMDVQGKVGGIERDLMWLAIARCSGLSTSMSTWLFSSDCQLLLQFAPPPILHATPPVILHLRAKSSLTFLSETTSILPCLSTSTLSSIFGQIKDLVISALSHLPDEHNEFPITLGRFLLNMMSAESLENHSITMKKVDGHTIGKGFAVNVQDMISEKMLDSGCKGGLEAALADLIVFDEIKKIIGLLNRLLDCAKFKGLAQLGVSSLFKRLAVNDMDRRDCEPFLSRLSIEHPQLLYKPLFSLSASSTVITLLENLRIVRMLSTTMGSGKFWLQADPQMLVITLSGQAGTKVNKGKGKEGEVLVADIKLGRYAVLIELLLAVGELEKVKDVEHGILRLLDSVEGRLGLAIEKEEDGSHFPSDYKALLCLLLFRIRDLTRSHGKSTWIPTLLRWFIHPNRIDSPSAFEKLENGYRSLRSTDQGHLNLHKRMSTFNSDLALQSSAIPKSDPLYNILHMESGTACAKSLVLLQAQLQPDHWESLLSNAWSKLGESDQTTTQLLFMIAKCCDEVPAIAMKVITSNVDHSSPTIRTSALRKIALLFAYRSQITSVQHIPDRRNPTFKWPHKNPSFLLTEAGSSTWVEPQDVQDEALKRFGSFLPLEVRQQLLQLGWSDDPNISAKDDKDKTPISRYSNRNNVGDTGLGKSSEETNDKGVLTRRSSAGSGTSLTSIMRRLIFPGLFWEVIADSVVKGMSFNNDETKSLIVDLGYLLQRDEGSAFLRHLSEDFNVNLRTNIARLNALSFNAPPGFAYFAFNTLIGYVKSSMRHKPDLPTYQSVLATCAWYIPRVSGLSFREVRRNKIEHILLPASFREEDGGFHVHTPWRDGQHQIQATQLIILCQLLKANTREVYLVKRMISNLPITNYIQDLSVSRAWLLLLLNLLGMMNRNYNDKSELRHFLSTTCAILKCHPDDLLIVNHAIHIFMLCSARFRRLFSIMGFQTVMKPLFDIYREGNVVIKDAVHCAMRSFYRIHQDAFVYQACLGISHSEVDGHQAYELLASLSISESTKSGIASGLKGMNDREELAALVQMLSGPEIALSEIGKDRAERQAAKVANMDFGTKVFPKTHIVKLFITVIAANPANPQMIKLLHLFVGMIPSITDENSRHLLQEGVDALASIIQHEKADAAAATPAQLGEMTEKPDWNGIKIEYVRLVEAFAKAGGRVGARTTGIVLGMILDLLRKSQRSMYHAASAILTELTKTQLCGTKSESFLKEISTIYRDFIGVVEFSGLLDEVTAMIKRQEYDVSETISQTIVSDFLEPSIGYLLNSSNEGHNVSASLRNSTVHLLIACVPLQADALHVFERHQVSPTMLAYLIYPLVTLLQYPTAADHAAREQGVWIRLLRLVIPQSISTNRPIPIRISAVTSSLSFQIIKMIILRGEKAISEIKGLWQYIASHIINTLSDSNGTFTRQQNALGIRIIDYMAWTLYELLSLHRNPLHLYLRHQMQIALLKIRDSDEDSIPASPTSTRNSPSPSPSPSFGYLDAGRSRMASIRRPSAALRQAPRLSPTTDSHHRTDRLSPTPEKPAISRLSSPRLSPTPSHTRNFSISAARPTFADLSARRASRAVFDLPVGRQTEDGLFMRFPSSAPPRNIMSERGGGAIVHLLGAPNQVLGAASGMMPQLAGARTSVSEDAIRDVKIVDKDLVLRAKRAVKVVQMIFGYEVEEDEDDEPIKCWTAHDALLEISDQTRMLVEVEFQDLFNPKPEAPRESVMVEEKGYDLNDIRILDETMSEVGPMISPQRMNF